MALNPPSRFNFIAPGASTGRTGTIKELLAEINQEKGYKETALTDFKALGPPLKFITQVTGKTFTSTIEQLPLTSLKTIKLLHVANDDSSMQMFRLLEHPDRSGKPTLEFSTTGNSPRDVYAGKIVKELVSKFETEIDPHRLCEINTFLLTSAKLLDAIECENCEILLSLLKPLATDDNQLWAKSCEHLALATSEFEPIKAEVESSIPLDEEIYIYLRCLAFAHFVGEYKKVLELADVVEQVNSILPGLEDLSREIRKGTQAATTHDAKIISIKDWPAFAKLHAKALSALVNDATGLTIRSNELETNIHRAVQVLKMRLNHSFKGSAADDKIFSLTDCVAALCAVRHQQLVKTKYRPYWHGMTEVGDSPLSYLGKARAVDGMEIEKDIPHGTMQLLHHRYALFHAAILGERKLHEARMMFRLARLNKYAKCLCGTDYSLMMKNVASFYDHCIQEAKFTHIAMWLAGE